MTSAPLYASRPRAAAPTASPPPPLPPLTWRDLALALAGPLAAGASLGWAIDAGGMLRMAALMPLSFAGIGLMTFPALYIGASLAGAAPSLPDMARMLARAARGQGLIYLGLTPTMLLMSATNADVHDALVVGTAGVALGVLVGVRVCFDHLRSATHGNVGFLVFALWLALSLALSAELYLKILRYAGGLA